MDAEEFRKVLAEVIRDELGIGEVDLAGKWDGGEMILKPARAGLQEKRIPLDVLFPKVIMIRERLRVLKQNQWPPPARRRRENSASAIRHRLLRVIDHLQRVVRRS